MKKFAILFACVLALAAHASDLRYNDIAGKVMDAGDGIHIEVYHFKASGVVFVEGGVELNSLSVSKFKWVIENGRLVIADGKKVIEKFELLARTVHDVKFRRLNGEVVIASIANDKE
jgi:hypothetical protein